MARGLRSAVLLPAVLAALAGTAAARAAAPVAVSLPSFDAPGGRPVELGGFWFEAQAQTPPAVAPAIVLLHGCDGLFDRRGALARRYAEMAERLNALGIHVLATDSLRPRGEQQICTQRISQRRVTQVQRRRDALAAMQWLAAQPGVDGARIGLLGWSHGGSTVLAAINQRHAEVERASVTASLAVAFYPSCEAELARGFAAPAPLLMLLGEADDWTPAAPCKQLAAAAAPAQAPKLQWQAYEGAHHGFDSTAPVRHRTDVPGGVRPGQGVHVGGDAAAREAAARHLQTFLQDTWSLKP